MTKKLEVNEKLVEKSVTRLEKIYATENGKNFVLHLVRAFLPVNNRKSYLQSDNDEEVVCSVTNQKLTGAMIYCSKTSDQHLSAEGFLALSQFVKNMMLRNDKAIHFIMDKKPLSNHKKSSSPKVDRATKDAARVTTYGDIPALKAIAKKFNLL